MERPKFEPWTPPFTFICTVYIAPNSSRSSGPLGYVNGQMKENGTACSKRYYQYVACTLNLAKVEQKIDSLAKTRKFKCIQF